MPDSKIARQFYQFMKAIRPFKLVYDALVTVVAFYGVVRYYLKF